MDIDAGKLTQILAERLTAIVPAGFHVRAADGMLWYSAEPGKFPGQSGNYHVGEAGSHVRQGLEARGEENLAAVAAQVLDELQDYIDEATHDPWPGDRNPPTARAQIRAHHLHLWYGTPTHEVLTCEPIPLTALRRR